jgi:ribonuclease VapC
LIVIDTSALMAIALAEPDADRAMDVLRRSDRIAMSAGTLAEALIVASRRDRRRSILRLVEDMTVEIVPVDAAEAQAAASAHDRWGRGVNPAGLNFGDCFAYSLAKARGWPLLYIGRDFARTDIAPALPPAP